MSQSEPRTETDVPSSVAPEAELDASGAFSRDYIEEITNLVNDGDREELARRIEGLYAADIADLIEQLHPDRRVPFVVLCGSDFDFTVLTEIDDTIRERLLADLPAEFVAQGVRELESDDAVYILEDLDEADQAEILEKIPEFERLQLAKSLEYPEESAGRRMSTEFIAVPPFWTVGQTIDYMRETEDLPQDFYELYVVDPAFHLQGTVSLQPHPARQAPGADLRDHGRRPACGEGGRGPGRGRPHVRALRPRVGRRDRRR